jgi:UDP-GlcNAc:undecaprenyl-phosphate GlcNAc-1-phosphate transferase
LNTLLTVLWVIAIVNALNLIDLMDGVAATIALVTLAAAGAIALLDGDQAIGALAVATAGAAAGFLPYNLARPSRIFLGDGGSMALGLMVAAATMALSRVDTKPLVSLFGAAVLTLIPLADMAYRAALRVRRGTPLMTAGRDSLLNELGARMSDRRTWGVVTAAQIAVAGLLLAARELAPDGADEAMAVLLGCLIAGVAWVLADRLTDPLPPARAQPMEDRA